MPDYASKPVTLTASTTGGADVDIRAVLQLDGASSQDGDATLVDTHLATRRARLRVKAGPGTVKLRMVLVAAPLVGNGEYETSVVLAHPEWSDPIEIAFAGDTEDTVQVVRKTVTLP